MPPLHSSDGELLAASKPSTPFQRASWFFRSCSLHSSTPLQPQLSKIMDGSSGTGSNANSSAGPFTSEESASQSHRQKADISWAHVSEGVNAQGRKTMTCIYCHKTFAGGGIFRMKQHLAGARGSIVSCKKVPPEVRHAISVTLKDIFEKKKEKKGEFGVENPFGRSVDEFDGDEVQEIPIIHTKGITINEVSAPSDKGKRKATTLGLVRIMGPLIRLLRVCDTDERPSLGYVYEGMYRAINGIKKLFKNKERFYKPYTDIINERWDRMLRKNLHAAAYYLNPAFQYDPTFSTHPEITNGLFDYIESKVDWCSLDALTYEIGMFRDRQGSFGRKSAILSSQKNRPESWWKLFGCDAQNLQKLAIRILGQTASSSGCERNWSVFERIHTKRRNRLEHQRLNDLVYVHYNLRLQYRSEQPKRSYDPVDYESIDKTDFWVVEETPIGELDYDELEEGLEELPIPLESSNFQEFEADGDEAEPEDVNLDLFQHRSVLVDEWI
ncbi:hypothetical protein ZIOFF_029484 [Zingiber officinale]|uniref:BED-type domain-containing protein n=1 Tax=Zingiber officinale TaxID=94328 RepID=A0A8J5GWQ7_ZINOF|nr:hypothetical protein ZIOFF_029484 [Zingiber officinale]